MEELVNKLWRWTASYKDGFEIGIVEGKDEELVRQHLKSILPDFLELDIRPINFYNSVAYIGSYHTFRD